MTDNDSSHSVSTPPAATSADLSGLAAERYVALTTFTRNGDHKVTPVWPVALDDGRLAFVTSALTWKVKRIRRDPRVLLRASDMRGRVADGAQPVAGVAEIVVGDRFDDIHRRVRSKYGYQLRIVELLHRLPGTRTGHPNDCAVVVSPGG